MKLTLDALRVIDAIHRKGSFAAAADELHRVRSALTYTVQKLERDLDVVLFDRTEHRAKLTPIGQTLLQEGRSLLNIAMNVEKTIQRLKDGWEEELFIAIDDVISLPNIYPLLKEFYQTCDWTNINLSAEILNGCWDALISGRVDLAIGVSGDAPLGREYGIMPLGEIEFVFAMAPSHPLAQFEEPLKNSDIIPYRAIVASDSANILPKRSTGILSQQKTLTVSSMQAKITAQIMGLGIGYLPLHLIKNELKTDQLIIKQVEKSKPQAHFSIAWRLNHQGKALRWFLDHLQHCTFM